MNKKCFGCSLWNNGGNGWGIYIGRSNARQYFLSQCPNISIQFEGEWFDVALDRGKGSSTFWNECPEFRHTKIRNWVHRNAVTPLTKKSIRFELCEVEPFKSFVLRKITA